MNKNNNKNNSINQSNNNQPQIKASSAGASAATMESTHSTPTLKAIIQCLNLTVLVAALGYFVDLFDIALFGVLRMSSLKALGITDPTEVLNAGVFIYNAQMIGMMVGGIFWGILADKKGRLKVLFGSILLYSIGNIANAFVWDEYSYALCRFVTGIGLAGELGAAVTIVAESLPINLRGIGTTIVATLGLCGSIAAAGFGKIANGANTIVMGVTIDWKVAYIVGGVMGLLLLAARMKMSESEMYQKLSNKDKESSRGNISLLFKNDRFKKYLFCIMAGAPIYFITGIFFTFSPEIVRGLGLTTAYSAADAILFGSIGLAMGDLGTGLLSQLLHSRKKTIGISLTIAFALALAFLLIPNPTAERIYFICFLLGLVAGYWAVMITVAAEQFGTNIRGTVATTVPNFIRGSAVLAVTLFRGMVGAKTPAVLMPLIGTETITAPVAALIISFVWFGMAFFALSQLEETFSKDLNYSES